MGGDRKKVIKVNKKHEARLAKIFCDSDEEDADNAKTEELLDKLDKCEVEKKAEPNQQKHGSNTGFNFVNKNWKQN